MSIPPVPRGKERRWLRCRECQRAYYHDFTPYGLANPVLSLPCHHGSPAMDFHDTVDRISEQEALASIARNVAVTLEDGTGAAAAAE